MDALKRTARQAGLLYLLMGIPAFFSLMYVPGKIMVAGDAAATVGRILAHESLFRLGIVSNLISTTAFIFLALLLHRLFKEVNRQHALLLVILVLVQIPMTFLNELNSVAALLFARGAEFLSSFSQPQRDSLAMFFLKLHTQGLYVLEIFWGLWLLPFGLLVYRSGFIPRILGAYLMVNGSTYLILSLTGLLQPQYYGQLFRLAFPALLGELAIQLWLLIAGVRPAPVEAGTAKTQL